jgi:hypothetical protein
MPASSVLPYAEIAAGDMGCCPTLRQRPDGSEHHATLNQRVGEISEWAAISPGTVKAHLFSVRETH